MSGLYKSNIGKTIFVSVVSIKDPSLRVYDTENHTEKKPRVTLKIERTKDMSNAENFQ